jgi:hypothetical protein
LSRNVSRSHWPRSYFKEQQLLCYYLSAHAVVAVIVVSFRLLGAGYSLDEIANATLEAESTKRARRETNKNHKWDGVNAIVELTGHNLRKILKPQTAWAKSAKSIVGGATYVQTER